MKPALNSFGGLVLGVVMLDTATKGMAGALLAEPQVLTDWLTLHVNHNTGIAWGLPLPMPVTILTSLIVLGYLAWVFVTLSKQNALAIWSLGLLVGGGLANLLERVADASVTDFIAFSFWPSFNFADITITLGAALLIFGYPKIFPSTHD